MAKKFEYQVLQLVGKNWGKASQTIEKNKGNMKRIARRLEKEFGLERIHNLKTKHVKAIFKDLIDEGLDPSTLSGYATAFRMIAYAIGKQNIVPRKNRDLGFSRRGRRYRPVDADMDQIKSVRAELYRRERWLGLAHDLRQHFGLRAKESLLSVKTVLVDEVEYLVVKGAKGNKARALPVTTDAQADVIQGIRIFLFESCQKSLVPSDKTLKQAYNRQRNELHRIGATKATKAHAHALRHQYAQKMKEMGVKEEDLVKLMGHGRIQALRSYCS